LIIWDAGQRGRGKNAFWMKTFSGRGTELAKIGIEKHLIRQKKFLAGRLTEVVLRIQGNQAQEPSIKLKTIWEQCMIRTQVNHARKQPLCVKQEKLEVVDRKGGLQKFIWG